MSWDGMLSKRNCEKCNKPLNVDGNHPAELYAGTYTGLCYSCQREGAYEIEKGPNGEKFMSHPPHCPSWRRDRETYWWFEDCTNPECNKGKIIVYRDLGKRGNYSTYCKECFDRHFGKA